MPTCTILCYTWKESSYQTFLIIWIILERLLKTQYFESWVMVSNHFTTSPLVDIHRIFEFLIDRSNSAHKLIKLATSPKCSTEPLFCVIIWTVLLWTNCQTGLSICRSLRPLTFRVLANCMTVQSTFGRENVTHYILWTMSGLMDLGEGNSVHGAVQVLVIFRYFENGQHYTVKSLSIRNWKTVTTHFIGGP
jgi:hypothetical protein